MRYRFVLVGLLLVAFTLGASTAVPAQAPARKVIEVKMDSFYFEPNQIRFNEDDRVILKLINIDQRGRTHNVASAWLMNIPLTVRGDGLEGTNEGRKFVSVEAGKQAEVEFVARGRGSYAFICSLFTHAWLGETGAFFVLPRRSP